MVRSPRILNAKTVYFENQTGSDPVGKNAFDELKKWGKYKILAKQKDADLILPLSSDRCQGGAILLVSGQTGSIQNGQLQEDSIPNNTRFSPSATLI